MVAMVHIWEPQNKRQFAIEIGLVQIGLVLFLTYKGAHELTLLVLVLGVVAVLILPRIQRDLPE